MTHDFTKIYQLLLDRACIQTDMTQYINFSNSDGVILETLIAGWHGSCMTGQVSM